MTAHSLSPMQEKLLEMIKWFHNWCVEHDLTYFAVGGTMLGAARHQGFIPWDDDLDVGMPRADYIRMCELLEQEQNEQLAKGMRPRYMVETIYMKRRDYLVPHAKIFDTETELIEHKKLPMKRGIFIDILPLDGTGETVEASKAFFAPIARRLDFLATRVCAVRKGRAPLKNLAVRISHCIPDKFYDDNAKMREIDQLCQQHPYETSTYVADLYGIKREKEIMPRTFFGRPKLYRFEDAEIYGVEDQERYLTHLFGNWREYPPIAEQVTHHDYISCDLNRSYLEDEH